MNKLAAEKVAHRAYIQGTQKALHELEFVKQALSSPFKFKRGVSTPLGVLAGVLGTGAAAGLGAGSAIAHSPIVADGFKALEKERLIRALTGLESGLQGPEAQRAIEDLAALGAFGLTGGGAALAAGLGAEGAKRVLPRLANKYAPIERSLGPIPLGKVKL